MNETKLEKHPESGNKIESAIIIIVENSIKTFKLYFKSLRFEGALQVVEKY